MNLLDAYREEGDTGITPYRARYQMDNGEWRWLKNKTGGMARFPTYQSAQRALRAEEYLYLQSLSAKAP